jgi:hypothetical protein
MSPPALNTAPPTTPLAQELAQLVLSVTAQALRDAAGTAGGAARLLAVRPQHPARGGPGVQALAAAHPGSAADKRQAQALYLRCLQHYREKVQPQLAHARGPARGDGSDEGLDESFDDVGTAAAFFVLANLGAYSDTEPDPAMLPAVERQLRHLLTRTAAWQQLGTEARQSMFEQLALLGVLMNESRIAARQQGPAARTKLAAAARGYLQTLLGLPPERLSATVQGLSVAEQLH